MSQKEFKVTIGADPELFLVSKKTGEYVSAWDKIPGTKAAPHKVECGAVQVDGNAVEFNIDPATTAKQFLHNIQTVKAQLENMLPEFNLVATPFIKFPRKEWAKLPKEAKELGCDPDYNAYTKQKNILPSSEALGPYRTSGGHIHVGWTEGVDPFDPNHMDACRILVKELDGMIGAPLCFLADDPLEFSRQNLYGSFGNFRPKSYGVEYRSPSSYWTTSEDLILWVFSQTKRAFNDLLSGKYYSQQSKPPVCPLSSSHYFYSNIVPAVDCLSNLTTKDLNTLWSCAVDRVHYLNTYLVHPFLANKVFLEKRDYWNKVKEDILIFKDTRKSKIEQKIRTDQDKF